MDFDYILTAWARQNRAIWRNFNRAELVQSSMQMRNPDNAENTEYNCKDQSCQQAGTGQAKSLFAPSFAVIGAAHRIPLHQGCTAFSKAQNAGVPPLTLPSCGPPCHQSSRSPYLQVAL